jgi:lipopolysaccharide export system permease protein
VRRLDRYVGRTVLGAIAMVLAIVVGLDAVGEFVEELEDLSETYTYTEALLYVTMRLPGRLYEYIPFAALIGCLIGLGQLASSSELVVMRSAGVSVGRLVWLAMKPALLVALAGFVIGEFVAPYTDKAAWTRRALAESPGQAYAGKHGLWQREANTFLHFNAAEPGGVVYGMTLLQFDERMALSSAVWANQARFQGDHWMMEEVRRTDFSSWKTTVTELQTMRWETGITPELLNMEIVDPNQLSLRELHRYGRHLSQQGLESDDYQLALWNKLLQPIAVAALVLVAISFIFGPLREGTMGFRIFAGVIIGILFRTSQDLLGPASLVFGFPPLYSAILPILICLVAGVLLLRRAT